MKIWALGDLHLPSTRGKTMEIFGPHWENHQETVARNWRAAVGPEDTVLLPGDFSWAMRLGEVVHDFAWLAALPGRKILIRGNHDYWWTTRKRLAETASPDIAFLHNNAVSFPPFSFAGTRGWELPATDQSDEENAERTRLCLRETDRLTRSLEEAAAAGTERLIVLLHFPPCYADRPDTEFTAVLDAFAPEAVVYGHLHGAIGDRAFQGKRGRTRYLLTSADQVDFTPVLVAEGEPGKRARQAHSDF
jgi:predicted phosphohydrolase